MLDTLAAPRRLAALVAAAVRVLGHPAPLLASGSPPPLLAPAAPPGPRCEGWAYQPCPRPATLRQMGATRRLCAACATQMDQDFQMFAGHRIPFLPLEDAAHA